LAAIAEGESGSGPLRLQFDRSVKAAFRGYSISSDGGLLFHRAVDDVLRLTDTAANLITDPRTGRNPSPARTIQQAAWAKFRLIIDFIGDTVVDGNANGKSQIISMNSD